MIDANRRITLKTYTSKANPTNIIEVKIYHTPRNWNTQAGYCLSVQPMMRSKHDGYTEECFTAFTGYRATIEPAPRYSAKKLETYQAEYNAKRGKAYQLTQQMIKRIIEQQQLDALDYSIEE
jgi:tartrate dehydratase beta subunit/fumarate hydratase class I family protein